MRCRTSVVALVAVAVLDASAAQRGTESSHRQDLVGRQFEARVVRVADGDTIEAQLAGETRPIRIRLEGIDAPEIGEAFSREAQTFLQTLVRNPAVRVTGRDLDNYGRLVARVAASGQDASTALVRAGLACHAYARDATLARDEAQARATGAGFWASNAAKPGCVSRTAFSRREARPGAKSSAVSNRTRGARANGESKGFRGNENSKLYHASWCSNFTCRNCNRLFASEAEAKMAGFKPAADCLR
jgi:micrococcal nuclease